MCNCKEESKCGNCTNYRYDSFHNEEYCNKTGKLTHHSYICNDYENEEEVERRKLKQRYLFRKHNWMPDYLVQKPARVVHCKKEDYDVYIGRGKCPKTGKYSIWGNPFIIGKDGIIKHVFEKRGYQILEKGTNISPAWVPNRLELAASLSYTGDPEIYLLTGTGKVIRRLTENRGIDVSPSWAPDGRQFAFVSKRSGTPQIYIQDLASGDTRRLTYEGKNNTQPSWSPRGDKIAYTAIEDGQINIRVIGVDGSGLRQLTINAGDNESPAWSPDGSLLVFSSTREGPSRIYVMNAFGTDQRRLLSLPGKQSEPKWSARLGNL